MKTPRILKALLPLALMISAPALADGGTEAGNGGSRTVLEFGRIAMTISDHLKNHPDLIPAIDRDRFENTVLNFTPIVYETAESVDCHTDSGVQQVTACNHADSQTIAIAGAAWARLPLHGELGKYQLATHEMLGLVGFRDGSGVVSSRIVDSLTQDMIGPYLGYWCRGRRESLRITRAASPDQIEIRWGRRRSTPNDALLEVEPNLTGFKGAYTWNSNDRIYLNGANELIFSGVLYESCSPSRGERNLN